MSLCPLRYLPPPCLLPWSQATIICFLFLEICFELSRSFYKLSYTLLLWIDKALY